MVAMLNETNFTRPTDLKLLINFSAYGLFGILILVTNGLVMLTILVDNSLRRSGLMPLLSLAVGNAAYGVAYITSSCYRLPVLLNGLEHDMVAPWTCFTKIYSYLFLTFTLYNSLALLTNTLDRVFAVYASVTYMALGKIYYVIMSLSPFIYSHCIYFVCLAATWYVDQHGRNISRLCLAFTALPPEVYTILVPIDMITSGADIVSGLALIGRLSYNKNKVGGVMGPSSSTDSLIRKREFRLTMTLSSVLMATLFFEVVPKLVYNACALAGNLSEKTFNIMVPVVTLFVALNKMSIFFIIMLRNSDMREGLRKIFIRGEPGESWQISHDT